MGEYAMKRSRLLRSTIYGSILWPMLSTRPTIAVTAPSAISRSNEYPAMHKAQRGLNNGEQPTDRLSSDGTPHETSHHIIRRQETHQEMR